MEYALIKSGQVENVIVADPDFITKIQADWDHIEPLDTLYEQGLSVGIGWGWDGEFYTPINQPMADSVKVTTKLTVNAFKRRLTQAERIAIRQAAEVNAEVFDFLDLLNTSTHVDLSDPILSEGLDSLTLAGILLEGRKEEILTSAVTTEEEYRG